MSAVPPCRCSCSWVWRARQATSRSRDRSGGGDVDLGGVVGGARGTSSTWSEPARPRYRLHMIAWHLRGTVLPEAVDRDVYIVDGRIALEPVEGATTLATDVVMLPGLVDVHAHLALGSPVGDQAPS